MKKIFLPPFLPLLIGLLVLVVVAMVSGMQGGAEGRPLRWIMFVPVMMLWLYPLLVLANGFDALIQRGRQSERLISVGFAGGALASVICLLVLKSAGTIVNCIAILSSFGAVGMMNGWRNSMSSKSRGIRR